MSKTLTSEAQHHNVERNLFNARRSLTHLVELYESGQWQDLYQEQTFANAVRQARLALEHWTDLAHKV